MECDYWAQNRSELEIAIVSWINIKTQLLWLVDIKSNNPDYFVMWYIVWDKTENKDWTGWHMDRCGYDSVYEFVIVIICVILHPNSIFW